MDGAVSMNVRKRTFTPGGGTRGYVIFQWDRVVSALHKGMTAQQPPNGC